MPSTVPRPAESGRYPLRNASATEDRRLARLEALSDPITFQAFELLGVSEGWRCAELGAGRGSVVRWLADRVGPNGSVTAIDRDTTRLAALAGRGNVEVVEADLCALELRDEDYDLVHSRSVLMHLDCPDEVVAAAVGALRPGGLVFFEESDGAPVVAYQDAPAPFARVMVPIAGRWTWAPRLPAVLESLGMVEISDDVSEQTLAGCTPLAQFWQLTLASLGQLLDESEQGGNGGGGFRREDVQAMSALLDDPGFAAPFTARHRVRARKPPGGR